MTDETHNTPDQSAEDRFGLAVIVAVMAGLVGLAVLMSLVTPWSGF